MRIIRIRTNVPDVSRMIEETLRQAYRQQIPIQLIYLDQKGNFSERCVRLCTLGQEEILAFCFRRRSYRRFKRERVLAVQLRRYPFSRHMPQENENSGVDPSNSFSG